MSMKIGFIGVGNMGSAIMRAVIKTVPAKSVYISDYSEHKISFLSKEYGVIASDNNEICRLCDYIFLGVKPQMLRDLLNSISEPLGKRTSKFALISMAAGVEISSIKAHLPFPCPVIRIMPNLPVSVGQGMTLYDASDDVSNESIKIFTDFMNTSGKLLRLKESLIDAGCSVSGCGPAFVCLMIEAMADAGVKCGLSRAVSLELASQTLLGTSKLLQETETHPALLKDAVCSPGGSTIAGVNALEQNSFRAAVMEAVNASFNRNKELGK